MGLKPDADEIRAHLRGLASSLPLDNNRKWWPDWLFRSDHVENAAAILNSGRLLSRAAAESDHLIEKDAGSPDHVAQLTEEHRKYVRLYFRPRTPTQYVNEGIRPAHKIQYDAHMPVPIYLLFAASLLAEEGVRFTKGRLTPLANVGHTAEFLRTINFSDVYHEGSVGRLGASERRATILNARHSEILVKNELSLDRLKHIVCRSAPERDTLLNLLVPDARTKWKNRIHVDEGRRRLFQRLGTFVQDANLSTTESQFVFYTNISPEMRGPFYLRIEWYLDGHRWIHTNPEFTITTHPVAFKLKRSSVSYVVRVSLNDDLAYVGKFDDDLASDIVF